MRYILTTACFFTLFIYSYPLLAQTCNPLVDLNTPDSRFELNDDEAKDIRTGLVWKRCSVGQTWNGSLCTGSAQRLTWQQALSMSNGDWRLPNIKELATIIEYACAGPAINENVFPNTWSYPSPQNSFGSFSWSSTPSSRSDIEGTHIWGVDFYAGNTGALQSWYSYTSSRVRLVRVE